MTAILLPDPVATVPSRVLDSALIAAFGLVPCPDPACEDGIACVLTSASGDVDFVPCPVCGGLGVVTGDRRDVLCADCRAVGFAHACDICRENAGIVEVAA